MDKKLNCWEYNNCGRQEGGENTGVVGICPAAVEKKLHGVHDGDCAGRACWVVAGTFCGGEVQGTFGKKFHNCLTCDFYKKVKKEEHWNFILSTSLLDKLGKKVAVEGS